EDRGGQVGSGLGLAGRQRQLDCHGGVVLDLPVMLRDPAEVDFEDLADVHTTGNTVGVEDHVDRSSVGEERHVLDRQDRRDDALVSVAAGHLVTDGDLAALGHVDADPLVDARRELIIVLTVEDAPHDDGPDVPVGVTLPTRRSPSVTSAPMRMMPRSSRSARASGEMFGMSRVISSAPSLVSRASTSCSSMWIEDRTSSWTRRWERMIASSKL